MNIHENCSRFEPTTDDMTDFERRVVHPLGLRCANEGQADQCSRCPARADATTKLARFQYGRRNYSRPRGM